MVGAIRFIVAGALFIQKLVSVCGCTIGGSNAGFGLLIEYIKVSSGEYIGRRKTGRNLI